MIKNILGGQFYMHIYFNIELVECFLKVSLCASLFFGVSLFDTLACYYLPSIFLYKKAHFSPDADFNSLIRKRFRYN